MKLHVAVIKDSDKDKYCSEPWVYVASSEAALNTRLVQFVKECADEEVIEAWLLGYDDVSEMTEAAEYAANPEQFEEAPETPTPRKEADLVDAFFDGEEHDTLGNSGRSGQRYQLFSMQTDLIE